MKTYLVQDNIPIYEYYSLDSLVIIHKGFIKPKNSKCYKSEALAKRAIVDRQDIAGYFGIACIKDCEKGSIDYYIVPSLERK